MFGISRLFKCGYCQKWLFRQVITSISCSLNGVLAGIAEVWMEPYNVELIGVKAGQMSANTYGVISSFFTLSDPLGAIISGFLMDSLGRKTILIICGPISLITWIMLALTRNIYVLYVVRLIQGLILGVLFSTTPVYISEISNPAIRGALSANYRLFMLLGILFTYTISTYTDYQGFIWITTAIPIIFIISFLFAPESPYYYLLKNKRDKATKSLVWLRANENVNDELDNIENNINTVRKVKVNFADLFKTKQDCRAFICVQIIMITNSFGGGLQITMLAKETLKVMPLILLNSDQVSIIIGVIFCISSLIAIFMSDTVGRRKLLVISTLGLVITNLLLSIIFYLQEKTKIDLRPYNIYLLYIGLTSLIILNSIGPMQAVFSALGEFFPTKTRALGSAVSNVIASLTAFIGLIIYEPVTGYFGVYMNFLILTIICVVLSLLIIIYIPETAGKSLEEISSGINTDKNLHNIQLNNI